MKTEIKIGDSIKTWCAGQEVDGIVIEKSKSSFLVEHVPVKWGKDTYTKTRVVKSTPLQSKYYSETSPKSFKNGIPITL